MWVLDFKTRQWLPALGKLVSKDGGKPRIAYSPDGRYLAAGATVISLFSASTHQALGSIITNSLPEERHPGVIDLVFSPDSQNLAIAYRGYWTDKTTLPTDALTVYALSSGRWQFISKILPFHSKSDLSTNLVYTLDGRTLLVGRWSLLPYTEREKTGKPSQYFTFIDYFDSQTGGVKRSITPVHIMRPTAIALSPDGQFLATGTNTGDISGSIHNKDPVKLWNLATGQVMREYPIHGGGVRALAISPDGRYLAVHQVQKILLFDFASGRHLHTVVLPGEPGFAFSLQLVFHPNGKLLAIPLDDYVYLITLK